MRVGRRGFIGIAGATLATGAAAVFGGQRLLGGDDLPPASDSRIVPTPCTGNSEVRQDWGALVREA